MTPTDHRRRVLVIDDDRAILRLLARLLERRGIDAVLTDRFELALEQASAAGLDGAIADVFMPAMGGVAGIECLRARFPRLRVIAMSGGFDAMAAAEPLWAAKRLGAAAVLGKPFSAEDLDAALGGAGLAPRVANSL